MTLNRFCDEQLLRIQARLRQTHQPVSENRVNTRAEPERIPLPEINHGTVHAYRKQACRCAACRAAENADSRRRRHARNQSPVHVKAPERTVSCFAQKGQAA